METTYLDSVKKEFEKYKLLADKTFDQLNEADFFWQYNEESNSIATIINHMHGNMLSRWTDFLTTDGEKNWRQRDAEFDVAVDSTTNLLEKWNAGWQCLFYALNGLNVENFDTEIYIRNQRHTVVDAINRQMMHYASHVGQIMYIGKLLKGNDWQSLSIQKGTSTDFNAEKFAKGKHD